MCKSIPTAMTAAAAAMVGERKKRKTTFMVMYNHARQILR